MIENINSFRLLSNNTKIPILGFGVHNIKEEKEFENAVYTALEVGYRHFDTASIYGNEAWLGKCLKLYGINRKEFFITTKLWKTDFGKKEATEAFKRSLDRLAMDYVDLYLIHWPQKDKLIETWEAFEELYQSGKIKAIGVSNFTVDQLNFLMHNGGIIPMVNQFEHHPYFLQRDLVDFCFYHNIQVVAHSPLMWGRIANDGNFEALKMKYVKSVPQIILRWNLQKNIVVIPKSSKNDRIIENAEIFDFCLDDKDMAFIDSLDSNLRIGGKP